jgi:hypothetical protein
VRAPLRKLLLAGSLIFWTPVTWSKDTLKAAHEKAQIWSAAAAHALEMRGDARSRLAAGVILASNAPADSPPMITAVALMGDEADALSENRGLGAMRMRICQRLKSCDSLGMAATMRWLDADNAATWLPNLENAYEDHDEVQLDRVLVDMAQSKRFFLYVDAAALVMLQATTAANSPASSGARGAVWDYVNDVISIYTPFLIPSPVPVLRVCSQATPNPQRRDSCLKVAALLQQGDSVLFQVFGLLIQRHFAMADFKTVHQLNERRRVLDWRQQAFANEMRPFLPWSRRRVATTYAELLPLHSRQEDLITALLRANNISLEPPSNAAVR